MINYKFIKKKIKYLTRMAAARVIGRWVFGLLGRVTCFSRSLAVLGFCPKNLSSLSRPLLPTKQKSTAVLHLYIFMFPISVYTTTVRGCSPENNGSAFLFTSAFSILLLSL